MQSSAEVVLFWHLRRLETRVFEGVSQNADWTHRPAYMPSSMCEGQRQRAPLNKFLATSCAREGAFVYESEECET